MASKIFHSKFQRVSQPNSSKWNPSWYSVNLYLRIRYNGLRNFQNQPLKNIDKLPQYTDDNLSFQYSCLWWPLTLLHSKFDEICKHCHAGLIRAHHTFNRNDHIPCLPKRVIGFDSRPYQLWNEWTSICEKT